MKSSHIKNANLHKVSYMATIYDGHTHIERRVYEDEFGFRYVKINDELFRIAQLHNLEVDVWYDG